MSSLPEGDIMIAPIALGLLISLAVGVLCAVVEHLVPSLRERSIWDAWQDLGRDR